MDAFSGHQNAPGLHGGIETLSGFLKRPKIEVLGSGGPEGLSPRPPYTVEEPGKINPDLFRVPWNL